jgi:hypothetical protein
MEKEKIDMDENYRLWEEWENINGTALAHQERFMNSLPEPHYWSDKQREVVKKIIMQNKRFQEQIEDGMDVDLYGFCD